MKFVLVTGAGGFLGTAITRKLVSLGVGTRALVRSEQKAALFVGDGADVSICDIRSAGIKDAVARADTVIHCAAVLGPTSLPRESFDSINVGGTRNLVEVLQESHDLRRFVHISSVAVVGDTDRDNPADERMACHPIDDYGQSKLAAENIVLKMAVNGFPAVVARPMWIYGASSLVTTNLFRKIAKRKLPMIGRGLNTMQPVALNDAVDCIVKCATVPGIEGRIFNIAGSEILTVRSMCETIAKAMNTTLPTLTVPMSVALPLARFLERLLPVVGIDSPLTTKKLEFFRVNNSYSIERARTELGWMPKKTFEQGAHEIAQAMKLMQQPS